MDRSRAVQSRVAAARPPRVAALAVVVALLAALAAMPARAATPNGAAAWGYNAAGQLGDGTTTIKRTPVAVSGLSGVTAVAAGGEHSLALLSNGTVMAWGANREGQLGTGSTASSRTPVAVSGLSGVTAVAAGREHSLALLANGTVMAWGSNEEGQLGLGTVKTPLKSTVPIAIKGLSSVVAISAGSEFSLALLSNGTVMAWGAGDEGQLGNGKRSKSLSPVAVKALGGVTAISAGGEHALALLSSGKVVAWGSNTERELGLPTQFKVVHEEGEEFLEEEEEPENSDVPVEVQTVTDAAGVAAGGGHSLALLGDGEVMAWGADEDGQLGRGQPGPSSNAPAAVAGLGGVVSISAGGHHNLALLSSGAVVAWGYDADGQLGDGSDLNSAAPISVQGLGGVVGIDAGVADSLSFGAPAPAVSGVTPASGSQAGGTSVTITGANLGEASAVRFGAVAASSFSVQSPTQIAAVSPPGAGAVDVTVTTPSSTSTATSADRFAYVPPPSVSKVKPNKGPAGGGTSVTITGANLGEASAVRFGAVAASSFSVQSPTQIVAVSPPNVSAPADIAVTTPSGTSEAVVKDVFKYEAPTISSLVPAAGPAAGGTSVTVTGNGFALGAGATTFKVGKAYATSVECPATTSCTFVAPPAKPGMVDTIAAVGKAKSKKAPPADEFTFE